MNDTPSGIVAALVAFQAHLPKIGRTAQAQYGKYADLGEVSATVLPALATYGLCYTTQLARDLDGTWLLHGALRHEGGETLESSWPIPPGGPQLMGGAITYARRYMLLAMTGVHPAGEDDDGQQAEKAAEAKRADEDRAAARDSERASRGQVDFTPLERSRRKMFAMLGQTGLLREMWQDEIQAIIGRDIESSSHLTMAEITTVIDTLRQRAEQPVWDTP